MVAHRPAVLALASFLAFAFAGCSGGGSESDGSSSTSTSDGPAASISVSASASASATSSSSSSSTSSGPPPAPQTVNKDITDNAFPDGTFAIRVGDTVKWTHKGNAPHSVSSDTFDSNPAGCPPLCMIGGQTYEHKFDAAGTFAYHCKVHSSMTGTITVA
jgi:plastocyanin